MSITIQIESLFKSGYSIKYITGWDGNFKRDKYTGVLSFYDGNPLYIVDVAINADRNKLQEEDIVITLGNLHNASNIEDMIIKKTSTIYELCKSSVSMGFALDLRKMKVIEPTDFNMTLPTHELNTLFMFENIPSMYYCLVNPTKNINDKEFYSWFISYIYSTIVVLTPKDKVESYAKKFMQAISMLCATNGDRKAVRLSDRPTILSCELNDIGELLLPIPGDRTKRFESLVLKSIEQFSEHEERKNKNK